MYDYENKSSWNGNMSWGFWWGGFAGCNYFGVTCFLHLQTP